MGTVPGCVFNTKQWSRIGPLSSSTNGPFILTDKPGSKLTISPVGMESFLLTARDRSVDKVRMLPSIDGSDDEQLGARLK